MESGPAESALAEQNHGPWPPAYSAASTARKDGSPDGVPNLAVISRPGLEPAWWGSGPGGALGVGLGVRVEGYLRPGGGLGVGLGLGLGVGARVRVTFGRAQHCLFAEELVRLVRVRVRVGVRVRAG